MKWKKRQSALARTLGGSFRSTARRQRRRYRRVSVERRLRLLRRDYLSAGGSWSLHVIVKNRHKKVDSPLQNQPSRRLWHQRHNQQHQPRRNQLHTHRNQVARLVGPDRRGKHTASSDDDTNDLDILVYRYTQSSCLGRGSLR